jgi:hypothetical protein
VLESDAVGFVHVTEDVDFWLYFEDFVKECLWTYWLSVEGYVQNSKGGTVGDKNVDLFGDGVKNSVLILVCILKGTLSAEGLRKGSAEYLHSFNLYSLVL